MKFKSTSIAWQSLTLPRQFLLAGAAVMIMATIIVGTWVANRIQAGVVQNSAISAALFMESYISPLSQDLALSDSLSPSAQQALEGIFEGGQHWESGLSRSRSGQRGGGSYMPLTPL